jgi:hypothetical protein
VTAGAESVAWHVQGTYFEACNCDAICPCRRIDGVAGGRSTHGICLGVLAWSIESGRAGAVDLSGLAAALALRYSDDEAGSPWRYHLYVDARGDAAQRAALEDVFLGRLCGTVVEHFPVEAQCAARCPPGDDRGRAPAAAPEAPHPRPSQRPHRGHYPGPETVSCVIPGHDQPGEELIAEQMLVDDGSVQFEVSGTAGYASVFEYHSGCASGHRS